MIRRVEGIIAVNAQVRGNDGRTRATGSTSVGRVSSHVTFVSCFGSISGCCSFFFSYLVRAYVALGVRGINTPCREQNVGRLGVTCLYLCVGVVE